MKFIETPLNGAVIGDPEPAEDERGFFARVFCAKEFADHEIDFRVAQCNVSFNGRKGTLRGMHYQAAPYEEAKLVRCTRGAVYDVVIDLRRESPTFKQWFSIVLTAHGSRLAGRRSPVTVRAPMLPAPGSLFYVPKGFAHGFQTLEDDTEVFYLMSEFYHPECARGVKWDDPAFGIEWPPVEHRVVSAADSLYPGFES